jgi:hypothetical protein
MQKRGVLIPRRKVHGAWEKSGGSWLKETEKVKEVREAKRSQTRRDT